MIDELKEYISRNGSKYSRGQITNHLVKYGYSREDINNAYGSSNVSRIRPSDSKPHHKSLFYILFFSLVIFFIVISFMLYSAFFLISEESDIDFTGFSEIENSFQLENIEIDEDKTVLRESGEIEIYFIYTGREELVISISNSKFVLDSAEECETLGVKNLDLGNSPLKEIKFYNNQDGAISFRCSKFESGTVLEGNLEISGNIGELRYSLE